MSDWRDEYQTLLEDCRKRDHMLSAWDADFLGIIYMTHHDESRG